MATSCFPLGKMQGLTYAQLIKYSFAVSVFKRVEAYNANVAIERLAGDKTKSYYKFVDSDEQAQYTLGLALLTQNDPAYATYVPVQKV
jgi:hypothetical protein